ncbi:hypothetical protein ABW19_dt0210613 [Dactylella cylindrospora]|nr:hypothetical protein ABW19_dt0210613 [Dactylella cylindrospora]
MFGSDSISTDPPKEQKAPPPSKPKPLPIQTNTDMPIPQPPSTANIIPPSPFTQTSKGDLGNKPSAKDIRAKFQLAASAYAVGGALSRVAKGQRPQISGPMPVDTSTASSSRAPLEPQSATTERPGIRDLRRENSDGFKVGVSISKDDLRKRTRSPTINSLQESIPERSPRRPESPAMQNLPESRKSPLSNTAASTLPSTENQVPERRPSESDPQSVPSIDISSTAESTAAVQEPASPVISLRDSIPAPKAVTLEVPSANESDSSSPLSDERESSKPSLIPAKHKRRRSTAATSARNKYLSQIDLTNMTVDIDNVLEEFGWDGRRMKVDILEAEVRRELAKVESGNIWIANDEENKATNETRIEELTRQLDETLAQCDELDGLLTLYAVELMSLQDDIAYIENQSQGLQVQTANQKTLQKELELLLQTISIAPEEIETLQNAKVQADQLATIESSLSVLYKAILTIDPSVGSKALNSEASSEEAPIGDSGMGKMVALKDKKDKYTNDCRAFSRRLIEYMKIKYRQDLMTLVEPAGAITPTGKSNPKSPTTIVRPKPQSHNAVYISLYKFSGLVLFTKDVDIASYFNLVKDYTAAVKDQFTEEIRGNVWGWKKIMRKPTSEDQEILFTHTEKESEGGVTGTVRTLTVKRAATRARAFKSPLSDGSAKSEKEKAQDGRLPGNECFAGFIDDIVPLVASEQNFLSEFFHMSSVNQSQTFLEFVQTGHPDDRLPGDLGRRRVPEQDKLVAKTLYETMSEIFGFLGGEMQKFVSVITGNDPLQGVGVIYAVEKKLGQFREGTNQEFLVKCLLKLNEQMKGVFIKFLKEQVRAIEATKVKYRKKRTVLEFIRSFPLFSAKIEDQLPPEQLTNESFEIREMVNNGYSIINRAMFDAMQAIAKQTPSANTQSMDPEDKESLNYHIMIIQNMDHYTEELEVRNNSVLQDFKQKAEDEFKEHMALYVGAVIRRYLEKTLDFVEGVEALEQTLTPEEILNKKNYTKLKFRDILNDHQKEISGSHVKDGIKQLVKRVTKHFGDEGHLDPLSVRILKEAENEYLKLVNRMNALLQGTYRDQGLEMPLKREDVTAAFAKQMSAK